MTGIKVRLPGFRIRDGKVVRNEKFYSVSQQLKRKAGGSKRVRVARRGTQ